MPTAKHRLPKVSITVGGATYPVCGHTALILATIALHMQTINDVPTGNLLVHFADEQVKLELTRVLPALRLATETATADQDSSASDR